MPKDDEILVRVHASSVNSWDCEFLTGKPFINRLMFSILKPKLGKQILGADIAGTVAAVGRRATRFQPGDAVFGDLWDNWNGFAEYACASETALERYDLIVDCQGYRSMFDYKHALRPGGTYAMVSGTIARVLRLLLLGYWGSLTRQARQFSLVAEGPNKGLADLKTLIEAGKLVSIVDRSYGLREVPEALRYFGEGRHKGKIVIAMDDR